MSAVFEHIAACAGSRSNSEIGGVLKHVIIDTDLSLGDLGNQIDDAVALALAFEHPDVSVDLVTTVRGNTSASAAAALTATFLSDIGYGSSSIIQGAESPIAAIARRPSGDPSAWLLPGRGDAASAGNDANLRAGAAMATHIMAHPGEVTVVALGPLTNLAVAVLLEPGVVDAVHEVVIMGGRFSDLGDTREPTAEFNVRCDPDAASIVASAAVPARWVGSDVASRVRLSERDLSGLAADCGSVAELISRYGLAWLNVTEPVRAGHEPDRERSVALYDPVAVAAAVNPGLLCWLEARVHVDLADPALRGSTRAVPSRPEDAGQPPCAVATDVDSPAVIALVMGSLNRQSV